MEFLRQPKWWAEIARELLRATEGEGEEMHEPQVSAHLVGDHLDNAMGNDVSADAIVRHYQEYVLVFDRQDSTSRIPLNLACLIALARKAAEEIVRADEERLEDEDTVESVLKVLNVRLQGLPNSNDRSYALHVVRCLFKLVMAPADQKEDARLAFQQAITEKKF